MHRLAVLLLGLGLLCTGSARAQRAAPSRIEVEGRVAVARGEPAPPRDRLLEAALLEAVVEVARRMLAPPVFEAQQQAIRAALEPAAGSFVLAFRPGAVRSGDSAVEPGSVEYLQPLAATVDSRRLRAFLSSAGWPPAEATRPSLVICARAAPASGPEQSEAALADLQRFVAEELSAREFVLIEPGVREGAPGCELGALELARALGADAGVDLDVSWQVRPATRGPASTIAEVALSARRTEGAGELALGRFQGVGHHDSPAEALVRALEAARAQAADNLALQLAQNWQEIASAQGPVQLVLVGVGGLGQVLAVRELLVSRLGVESAELSELGPGTASLRLDAHLSPGALRDRLAAAQFEGFALEPVEAPGEGVSLRVREAPPEPAPDPQLIDTQEPN